MNIFVLSTGRCGSTTFIKACRHITNYSSAHESRVGSIGDARTAYPDHHIEADNRLSWFLGRLDEAYGNEALYIHLTRDPEAVALSHMNRYYFGITKAYREAIFWELPQHIEPMTVALDYVRTVNTNIALFLQGRPHQMHFRLEHAVEDFRAFWERIGAEGDLDAALDEFRVKHNASRRPRKDPLIKGWSKVLRIAKGIPAFLRNA